MGTRLSETHRESRALLPSGTGWLWVMLIGISSACGGSGVGPIAPPSSLTPPPAPTPTPTTTKITIEAYIDGRSRLILREGTVQWHHLDHAAPGRWQGLDSPTVINSTTLWLPTWPDQPTAENRDCGCWSSIFDALVPPIPHGDVEVRFTGRHITRVIESPNASNAFTLILEFDDNDRVQPSTYSVAIDWATP